MRCIRFVLSDLTSGLASNRLRRQIKSMCLSSNVCYYSKNRKYHDRDRKPNRQCQYLHCLGFCFESSRVVTASCFTVSRVMRKLEFGYAKTKALVNCAVTAQLIKAFVFARYMYIVQSLFFLNPKFQASSHLRVVSDLVGNPMTGFVVTRLTVCYLI